MLQTYGDYSTLFISFNVKNILIVKIKDKLPPLNLVLGNAVV